MEADYIRLIKTSFNYSSNYKNANFTYIIIMNKKKYGKKISSNNNDWWPYEKTFKNFEFLIYLFIWGFSGQFKKIVVFHWVRPPTVK